MKKSLAVLAVLSTLFASSAFAEIYRKEIASLDIQPCSKGDSYRDDFGIRWPTVKFARQTLGVVVSVGHTPELSFDILREADNECVGVGLAAAAGISLLTSPATFKEAFAGAYTACMYARVGGDLTGIGVNIETKCHW